MAISSRSSAAQVNATIIVSPNVVGVHGNAWDNVAVGAGGLSNSVDCQFTPFVSIFGNSSGATMIIMQVSQDNVNFFDAVTQVVAGPSNFYFAQTVGARFIRLRSSQARTITATIAAKD